MRKILIFSTAYFPHVGGAEVAIKEITDRIGDAYECDLICARYTKLPSVERIGRVTVYRVGVGIRLIDKLLSPFLGTLLALALHKKHSYSLFWAMMATYGSGGAYIANFFLSKKVPVVLTLQEGDPPAYLRTKWFGLVGLAWRLALSQSSHVTVLSSYLGELARSFGYKGVPTLIPNAVDTSRFSATFSAQEQERMKRALNKKEGEVFVVTTSRLVHKNGVDDVIRALVELPPHVIFLIYGVGPDEQKLRALAKSLQVESRARFMGHISHVDMPLMLSVCDIFIRPSRSEGFGNSFIEAMASGLPVVATQEGGIADFLFDATRNPEKETTGWAVDADAPKQIASAILQILNDPTHTAQVTQHARRLVKEKYDWSIIANDMRKVFDVVGSSR